MPTTCEALFVLAGRILIGLATAVMGLPLAADAEATNPCETAFTEAFHEHLDEAFGHLAITAAVHDTRTGCQMHLAPELRLTTASAIKLHLLGATLERHEQRSGELTAVDLARAERMIHYSHNSPPTSELYVAAGVNGMDAYGAAAGAPGIDHTAVYGITRASAAELNHVAMATLYDDAPGSLTAESRAVAREIVGGVHHSQQWGISRAAPDGWQSLAKNGFFPCASQNCAPFAGIRTWRIASTGVLLAPDGAAVAITILTDGASTQQEGMDAVEHVARAIGLELFGSVAADRAVDDASCTTVVSGDTTTSIVNRLGLPAPDWAEVRWVSGNEGPLVGQLMCAPQPLADTAACICPVPQR